jgi:nucleoside-diphosphate-sugar epimerase
MENTAHMISDVMNASVQFEQEDQRVRPEKSEVERLWADNSKAKMLTGWEPQYAGKEGLKKGLIETVEWFAPIENLMKYKSDVYTV